MQRVTRSVTSLLLASVFTLASLIVSPTGAHAETPYDNVIVTADNLVIVPGEHPTMCSRDFSSNWESLFRSQLSGSDLSSFDSRAAWAVSRVKSNEGFGVYASTIYIDWWETVDLPATATFQSDINGNWSLKTKPTHRGVLMTYWNSCDSVIGYVTTPTNPVPLAMTSTGSYYVQHQPYLLNGVVIDYTSPYQGKMIPTTTKYVAMGDSYSSGEGSIDNYYTDGTTCHRSPDSYSQYLVSSLALSPMNFVACSGAVTDDLFGINAANPTEPAQLDYVNDDTEYVTLTIGGNDIGFGEVLKACASSGGGIGYGCSSDTALNASLNSRLSALAGTSTATINGRDIHSILEVLEAINEESPGVKIFIGGYPKLFGASTSNYTANTSAPGSYECIQFGGGFAYSDTQWMNGLANTLNGVISSAVDDAVLAGIDATFVPANLFDGHGHCDSGASYLNWIMVETPPNPMPESFHPTPDGQWLGYGLAFEALMN